MGKIAHFLMIPWTGLGLYGGYRGDRWLRNRIKVFEQFVLPSLLNQTNKDFILWCAWRFEEKRNRIVIDFEKKLSGLNVVHTYSGCPFWDDKYPDDVARLRLIEAIHGSMGELINVMGECDEVLMTIQPSDDCYYGAMVEETQTFFKENPGIDVFGYKQGYVMDYINRRLAQWNPSTTPPFYTIKFKRETFIDPLTHIKFTGPYRSHEYLKDHMKTRYIDTRGFLVGTHGENISTVFNHPFTGHEYSGDTMLLILADFGLANVGKLEIKTSLRKIIMRRFPHGWQKKFRYWFGEHMYNKIYEFLR